MELPKIKLQGAYPAYPSRQKIIEAAIYYGQSLAQAQEQRLNCDQIHGLCLLELEIEGPFSVDAIKHHTQHFARKTVQVPYLEFYLDSDGLNLTYHPRKHDKLRTIGSLRHAFDEVLKSTSKRKLCFFMHFLNPQQPLLIDNTPFTIPCKTDMPDRLIPFAQYVPVD